MEKSTILSCVLTVSSILVAIGFPFIIFIVTDYKNKREKLLEEIKTYYPKLDSFRKLIYFVFNIGIMENYDINLQRAKTEKEKQEIEKSEVYSFFSAFKYISERYSDDMMKRNSRIFSYGEVKRYKYYANAIYYYIDCRTNIKPQLNNKRFENLEFYESEHIRKAIAEMGAKYLGNKLTIDLIALIAGNFEVEIARSLVDKTRKYEKPIPKIVKHLFIVLTISILFGIILPLIFLQFPALQYCLFIMLMVFVIILCFSYIVLITGKYIWSKM